MRKIHDSLMEKILDEREKKEKRYNDNLRSRKRQFYLGQIVFPRMFHQSDVSKRFNTNFAQKFVKCKIATMLSDNRFQLFG